MSRAFLTVEFVIVQKVIIHFFVTKFFSLFQQTNQPRAHARMFVSLYNFIKFILIKRKKTANYGEKST